MDKIIKKQLDSLFGDSPPRELKLSYSRISDFSKVGPKALIERSFIGGEGVRIGSLTDDLLYSKKVDKNHFNTLYYIYDGSKPLATLGKLINVIIETKNDVPSKDEVLKLVKSNSFWSTTKNEDLLCKNFDTKQFWDYLEAHYKSKNKTIVGSMEYSLAEELVNTILTHEHTKELFVESKDKITLYQYPIKFNYNGFIIRGILDFLRINHKEKTVELIDLKTGKDDPEMFSIAFLKHRYDLQEAVYTLAFAHICNDLGLKGYTLKPFKFLYISRYEKTPIFYEVSKKWHVAAKKSYKIYNRHVKGLYELIDEIKWHWDNKIFDKSKLLHESKGNLVLEDDYITIN